MAIDSDASARLSAARVCALTGVRPQTRDTWVKRGLLRASASYGQLDVIEQAVIKDLLATLPKSHVEFVWHEIRPVLRGSVSHDSLLLVWDPEARIATLATTGAELTAAACTRRPIYVLPLGEVISEARRIYRSELLGAERAEAARDTSSSQASPSTTRDLASRRESAGSRPE